MPQRPSSISEMNAIDSRGMDVTDLYLDLLKGCLGRSLFGDELREGRLDGWRARA